MLSIFRERSRSSGRPGNFIASETSRLVPGENYDVSPDGRFLMIQDLSEDPEAGKRSEILVIQNWAAEFTQR